MGSSFLATRSKKPSFFYYENVTLTPKGVWDTISCFLYDIEPELVNSKFFSACARDGLHPQSIHQEQIFPHTSLVPYHPAGFSPIEKVVAFVGSKRQTKVHSDCYGECRAIGEDPHWVGKEWGWPIKGYPTFDISGTYCGGLEKSHSSGTDRYSSLGNSFQVSNLELFVRSLILDVWYIVLDSNVGWHCGLLSIRTQGYDSLRRQRVVPFLRDRWRRGGAPSVRHQTE